MKDMGALDSVVAKKNENVSASALSSEGARRARGARGATEGTQWLKVQGNRWFIAHGGQTEKTMTKRNRLGSKAGGEERKKGQG